MQAQERRSIFDPLMRDYGSPADSPSPPVGPETVRASTNTVIDEWATQATHDVQTFAESRLSVLVVLAETPSIGW